MHFAGTLKLHTLSLHNLHFHWNVSAFDNQMLRFESQMPELSLYWTLGGGYNLPTSAWITEIHTEMTAFYWRDGDFVGSKVPVICKCSKMDLDICSSNDSEGCIYCDWWYGINWYEVCYMLFLTYPVSTLTKWGGYKKEKKRWIISSLVTKTVGLATIKVSVSLLDAIGAFKACLVQERKEARIHLSSKLKSF